MKRILLSLVAVATISLNSFGQAPEGFKYQAVVRDAGNTIINNQAVGVQMTIQQGSIGGTTVYQETFAPTTNTFGLVNLEIGTGSVVSGNFSTIDWDNGPYFIETAIDVTGGVSYTVMGTSQLMSVPYALHANTAENVINDQVDDADADPTNEMNSTVVLNGTDLEVTDGNGTIITDLSSLQDVYTAGEGIDITNNVISTTGCELSIGQSYMGGIIFYLDSTGCHGLIAADTDQSTTGIHWYNGSNTITNAVRDGIGAGAFNTERIIANQGPGAYAAQICANYQGGNYGDWYLPSKFELNLMYQNIGQGNALGLGNVGGFANNYYYSSTEFDLNDAWQQGFGFGGTQANAGKWGVILVRAIREF